MGDSVGFDRSWVCEPFLRGESVRWWVRPVGDACQCSAGGGVPHELLELVRRRWPGGGWPAVNCTLGGESCKKKGSA